LDRVAWEGEALKWIADSLAARPNYALATSLKARILKKPNI